MSLLIATIDAPHILILDEPTNHLDIESREALVEALTTYSGAVILVSHDMHLLSLLADRLWLVSDGTVKSFDGDLESYRARLLARDKPIRNKPQIVKSRRPSRDTILALRADLRKCEDRIEKLSDMHKKLSAKLAEPALYEDDRIIDLETWNRKFAEVAEAMQKAEALWVAAVERLEQAEAT